MAGAFPVIPDYELLRPIGRGAYGEVWLARSVTGIYRAAKIVYRANFEEARPFEREFAGIQRFEPLARAQENQITILHVGRNEAAGYFYYVMELADDATADALPLNLVAPIDAANYKPKTLKEVLARRGRLPVLESLPVAIGLCNALEHLHGHGLIHRDVKPSNIIFVNGQPKLADIGLVSSVDATRSFVGTEGYMPREGPGLPAADLYSLGKVLYEAATGRSRSDFPLLPADLETIPDRAALLELNEVIIKACADDPSKRYASAADMRAELLLIQAGKSVKRLHAVERQLKRLVPAGVILGVLAGAIILIQQFQTSEVQHRAQLEAEYRKKAEEQALATRQLLYAADMNLVQQAYAAGDFGRARTLLGAHLSRPGEADLRGFEWRYFWEATQGQQQITLTGHSNAVRRVAFSPDGRMLASASYDRTVRLWDLSREAELASFTCEGTVRDVAFSSDGSRILFLDETGKLECRNVTTLPVAKDQPAAKTHARLFEVTNGIVGMAVSPTENFVAVCYGTVTGQGAVLTDTRASISLLDLRDGHEIDALPDVGPLLTFSPDGKRLATAGSEKHIRVWDLATRQVIAAFQSKEARFNLSFSPDGKSLAQGDGVGNLRLRNLSEQRPPREVHAHQGTIWQVAFSPDAKTLATVGTDQTLRLWDARTLTETAVYRGHNAEVWGLNFSRDGKQIATASKDETVRIWNIAERSRDQPLTQNVLFWEWPVFSTDGRLIAAGERGVVKIWRTTDGAEIASFTNVSKPLFFGEGEQAGDATLNLAALGFDGALQSLPCSGQNVSTTIHVTNLAPGTVRAHAFHPQQHLLALGHRDGTVRIWNLASRNECQKWKAHSGSISSLAFSAGGDCLLSASTEELAAKVWSIPGAALRHTLNGHKLPVFSVGFSPDGKQMATASSDDTCRLWDAENGRPLAVLNGHKGGAFAVAFTPDGKTLAVGTGHHQVRLWNMKTFRDMGAIETDAVTVFFAQFAPDAETLATVSYDTERNQCSLRLLRARMGK